MSNIAPAVYEINFVSIIFGAPKSFTSFEMADKILICLLYTGVTHSFIDKLLNRCHNLVDSKYMLIYSKSIQRSYHVVQLICMLIVGICAYPNSHSFKSNLIGLIFIIVIDYIPQKNIKIKVTNSQNAKWFKHCLEAFPNLRL